MAAACNRCQKSKIVEFTLDDSMEVSGHIFMAQLPATRCGGCGQIVIQGHDMKKFELAIAAELAKAGTRNAAAFKYMREAVGLTHESLAGLLDVDAAFIGYWEKGEWPLDPRAHGVLCSLVSAKLDDRPASLDCLRILREPRQLARKVRVQIGNALAAAKTTLQFGSAAFKSPALA